MPLKDRQARREYHREYMKRYLADPERKAKHLARVARNNKRARSEIAEFLRILKSNPCTDCKQTFDPVCMDFDHVGEKDFGIASAVWGVRKSLARIKAEIAKCELVCSNCHRLRTKRRLAAVRLAPPPQIVE